MYVYIFIYIYTYYIYIRIYIFIPSSEWINQEINWQLPTSLRSCIRVFCSSAPLKACRRASTIFSNPSWQRCYPGKTWDKNDGNGRFKQVKARKTMAGTWLPYGFHIIHLCIYVSLLQGTTTGKTTWDWTKQTRGSGWRLMDVETPISTKDNGKVVGIDFIQETSMACWIIPQNGWLSYNNGVFPLRKWCGMVLSSLDLCFALPRQHNHGTMLGWLEAQL